MKLRSTLRKLQMQKVYSIALLFSLLLASCAAPALSAPPIPAGEVIPLALGSTLFIMRDAVAGSPYSMIMNNGNQWMLARALADNGWAFILLDVQGKFSLSSFTMATGGNGNVVSPASMADVRNLLLNQGWKAVAAAEVPAVLRTAILSSSSWIARLSSNMTTFFVLLVPVQPYELLDQYIQPEVRMQ